MSEIVCVEEPKVNDEEAHRAMCATADECELGSQCTEMQNAQFVGRRVRILVDPFRTVWCEGTIRAYDALAGHHLVEYDDGVQVTENLNVDAVTWMVEAQ